MGLANSMGPEPNITPRLEGSVHVCSIVPTQGGASEPLGSSTKSGKPRVKFVEVITRKVQDTTTD